MRPGELTKTSLTLARAFPVNAVHRRCVRCGRAAAVLASILRPTVMPRLTAAFLLAFLFSAGAAERRPDMVIFLTDDHSQADSTPYGSTALRTPNMQRLAEAGLTFTRA